MTPLGDIIIRQIERFGPMSIAEYMTQCLLHPEHGYYTTHQPFGAQGDFITAPEISQMFGELIGLSIAQTWMDQGAPSPFCLAELGPGRGTLMADILRATKNVPDFHSSMHLILVEASPTLQKTQQKQLFEYDITWKNDVSSLPETPLFLIANEFFDCLPVKQFKRTEDGWHEQLIWTDGAQLQFVLGTVSPDQIFPDRPVGSVIETSPSSAAIAQAIARHIAEYSGAAIFIDYGGWGSDGDTLQALKNHKKIDPLEQSGNADLTTHVDFQALSDAMRPFVDCSDLISQGVLLERLGITQRAQTLATKLNEKALENHIEAHNRLTHPEKMGNLFKAIAITQKNTKKPAGFE